MQCYTSEWNQNKHVEWFNTDPNETKTKSVAQLRVDIGPVSWNVFVSALRGKRQHSLTHFPTLLGFETCKHMKWECMRFSTQVYAKIHSFTNNTTTLYSMRFATDAEVRNAVQKVLRLIPAEEFEKTTMQKWQEQIQECIINHRKYLKGVCW